jgi:hypothetical protein
MKFKVVELIPYSTFKERLKIIKEYDRKAKIEIFEDYIYIERTEVSENYKTRKENIRKVGSR